MTEEAPNVVTEDGLRKLLALGYRAEVVCKETGGKRHNTWTGNWIIRAVGPDNGAEKLLVTSRAYFKVREFKTVVGLVSFLSDMGFTTAHVPLEAGGRVQHQLPTLPTEG